MYEHVVVPESVNTVVLPLPSLISKADDVLEVEKREIWFETSREGVIDREGEDIACEALWASRKLFLEQGNIDIAHFSWTSVPQDSNWVIGHPTEVRKSGKSILVKAELFNPLTPPPVGSSGWRANLVWHDLAHLNPPKKYFPSVLGKVAKTSIINQVRNGKNIRYIKGPIEWYSVGIAMRAQHPVLGAVQTTPLEEFLNSKKKMAIKGDTATMSFAGLRENVLLAKAVTSGNPNALMSMTSLRGTEAVRTEQLEGAKRAEVEDVNRVFKACSLKVAKQIREGKVKPDIHSVAKAFEQYGVPARYTIPFAKKLGKTVYDSLN